MSFQRARSDDQIKERIQEIIAAASSIYDDAGYEALNFNAIAEYTKFTRPSIYRYFKTKDEILLILLQEELKSYTATLIQSFKINKIYSLKEITQIWTDNLERHERLLDLYAILFTTIENNVSREALAAFKKEIAAIQFPLFDIVCQLFPKADHDSIETFIYSQLTLAFGLYPMTKLSNHQKEAIQLSGVDYTPPDFRKTYMSSLYQLMYCLEHAIIFEKE